MPNKPKRRPRNQKAPGPTVILHALGVLIRHIEILDDKKQGWGAYHRHNVFAHIYKRLKAKEREHGNDREANKSK